MELCSYLYVWCSINYQVGWSSKVITDAGSELFQNYLCVLFMLSFSPWRCACVGRAGGGNHLVVFSISFCSSAYQIKLQQVLGEDVSDGVNCFQNYLFLLLMLGFSPRGCLFFFLGGGGGDRVELRSLCGAEFSSEIVERCQVKNI